MVAELSGDHVAHLVRLQFEGSLGEWLDHRPGSREEVEVAAVLLRGAERIAGRECREQFVRLLDADLFLLNRVGGGRRGRNGLGRFLLDHLLDAAELPGRFLLLGLIRAGREQDVPGAHHRAVEHIRAAREQALKRGVRALALHEGFPLQLRLNLGPELFLRQHHRGEFGRVILLDRDQFLLQFADEVVDFLRLDVHLDGYEVVVDQRVLDEVVDDFLAGHLLGAFRELPEGAVDGDFGNLLRHRLRAERSRDGGGGAGGSRLDFGCRRGRRDTRGRRDQPRRRERRHRRRRTNWRRHRAGRRLGRSRRGQ